MPQRRLSTLPKRKQHELLDDLNYLNMAEILSFCKRHFIPYTIRAETTDGKFKTAGTDRKGVILDRIRHYLNTGEILPETHFPAGVVQLDASLRRPQGQDRLRPRKTSKSCGA